MRDFGTSPRNERTAARCVVPPRDVPLAMTLAAQELASRAQAQAQQLAVTLLTPGARVACAG